MQSPKHIHLIGICGTAMASLAGMLQLQGHSITGSDAAAYPPMGDLLAELNIPIHEPYAESNLEPRPDLVVVGNAISRGNVELEYVLDTRIPFCSMASILHDEFLQGRESLVVAGTHGKTTTTSMLAWIYEVASRRNPELAPSFLIGGVAENFGTSFMVRSTRPFLLEGDEYDTAFFDKGPKFLHYYRSLCREDGVQAIRQPCSATWAHRCFRWQRERQRVRFAGLLRGGAVWLRGGLLLARLQPAPRWARDPVDS